MHALHLEANLERLVRVPNSKDDKYSRGVAGFVTGSDTYPGAALLGVGAALNCSIGMVRYVGERRVQDLVLAAHPEVVCRTTTGETGRVSAWVLGSGVAAESVEQLANIRAVFAAVPKGVLAVVDAGAIEALDFAELKSHSLLLTPHAGELARLLNRLEGTDENTAESVTESSFLAANRAAKLTGQTILLKGNRTVVIKPSGEGRVIGPNSPHLATAGSGDVLAGIIGAIAAANADDRKFEWLDVAELSVRMHSAAAELASESGAVNASSLLVALGDISGGMLK